MSFSMNKLRSILPRSQNGAGKHLHQSFEPEIGFQISIEAANGSELNGARTVIPELNVHLIAARHLPTLFGFKIVQGYLIKVKLFPGHKRVDSSIQTNSWPKFNETFKFPLAPDIKPSLKHSSRRGSKAALTDFTPEELFAGQFVVFTVYALLELPPTSFNRFSETYRSFKDKSSNLMQNIFETSMEKLTDDNNSSSSSSNKTKEHERKNKRKSQEAISRDAMPPLTISESRRNLGSVTCYLQPKLFKRNSKGIFATEELWMPIKDITTTVKKPNNNDNNNNLGNSTKGVVELVLEVKDCSEPIDPTHSENGNSLNSTNVIISNGKEGKSAQSKGRMTSEMKRKMGIRNVNSKTPHELALKITTSRMRCTNKVKDELEATAGSVYVKTTVFEHGIYIDSWKSANFYPSLSTKWEVGNVEPTITVPLQSLDNLDNMLIKTTLATKTKMGKKLVLGTVIIGGVRAGSAVSESGAEHMATLKESPLNERVAMWHCYQ